MTSRSRLVLGALALCLLAACGGGSGATGDAGAAATPTAAEPTTAGELTGGLPVTVTSADGREVVVEDASRIVPLVGNIAEVVFDLGHGDAVVGRDISATFAAAADLPIVTRGHDVSAESVLSLRPTLVLVDEDTGPPEALDHLRNVGVPVVVLARPHRVEDVEARIRAVADILGDPAAADAVVAGLDTRLAEATAAVPDSGGEQPTVAFLYLRGSAGVALIGGPGAGPDSLIEHAGGIDAGTALGLDDPFTPITSEALAGAQPDVFLLTTTGLESVGGIDGLLEMPGIAQTPAGADRRVITVEDGLLFSFSARTPDALASIVEQLHR